MIGPAWTAPHGGELQPKLQPAVPGLVPEGDTCRMSRAARRREQLGRLQRNLPPEYGGAVVWLGMIYAPAVIIIDLSLAAVLSRSILRSWRARRDGLAAAVQAGVSPALIGLVGAMAVNELVRAVVFRTLIRPALTRAESAPSA
jgi:hypothetical protein